MSPPIDPIDAMDSEIDRCLGNFATSLSAAQRRECQDLGNGIAGLEVRSDP